MLRAGCVLVQQRGEKSPVEYLRKYPDRIEMLHIKDDFVIGASGTIDFKGIFEQFYANGMKDYVVEIETPGWLREKRMPTVPRTRKNRLWTRCSKPLPKVPTG